MCVATQLYRRGVGVVCVLFIVVCCCLVLFSVVCCFLLFDPHGHIFMRTPQAPSTLPRISWCHRLRRKMLFCVVCCCRRRCCWFVGGVGYCCLLFCRCYWCCWLLFVVVLLFFVLLLVAVSTPPLWMQDGRMVQQRELSNEGHVGYAQLGDQCQAITS